MKIVIASLIAFGIGAGSWWARVPSLAPQAIPGSLLIVAMTKSTCSRIAACWSRRLSGPCPGAASFSPVHFLQSDGGFDSLEPIAGAAVALEKQWRSEVESFSRW
jgi:XapX domain-containing protein